MSAPTLSTELIVLAREQSGDSWMRVTGFSIEQGRLDCMQRISTRAATVQPALDLFDTARVVLETRNQGRTWFVRESLPVRRRGELARSYAAFLYACRFAAVLAKNPVHDDGRAAVSTLLDRALDAWAQGNRPEAIYFKSLYVFARDEGYPVREEWIRSLDAADRALTRTVLRQPAQKQSATEKEIARLIAALEEYLHREHDFHLSRTQR